MPRDGSGTFNRTDGTRTGATVWVQARDAGINVNASPHDTHDTDLGDALTASIAKDGQTTPTANLPMGTFRHTNVGAAVARTDYARASDVQDSAIFSGTSGGAANAYTLTTSPAIAAYAAQQRFRFKIHAANTGATTLAVSGLAAIAVQKAVAALTGGEMPLNGIAEVVHDGTQFQLISVANHGDGTLALPGIAFGADTDNGLYRLGANNWAASVGGTKELELAAGKVDMSTGALHVKNQKVQGFVLQLNNVAGTLKHAIYAELNTAGASNFAGQVSGQTSAQTTTPTGADAATAMAAGAKISSANTNRIILNTAVQTIADCLFSATVDYNDTGTALNVDVYFASRNVNGVTQVRVELVFTNATSGAAFALTTGNIGAGLQIQVRLMGYIA